MPKVRDAMRLVEHDGWRLVRINGSHRIYQHPAKTGIVVIAGQPGVDLATGTYQNILRQAQLK
jgi:predicted RNA binding protein YcfA (HicA-like mRNA interferase family)